MFKCPHCKNKIENKGEFLNHLVFDCNYSFIVANEIVDEQDFNEGMNKMFKDYDDTFKRLKDR